MALALIVVAFLVVVAGIAASRVRSRREARSVQDYSRAMQVLAVQEHQPVASTVGPPRRAPERIPARRILDGAASAPAPAPRGADPLSGLREMDRHGERPGNGRVGHHAAPGSGPPALEEVARIVGVFEDRSDHDPGVEANARLTAATGLLLVVLFFLEGLTLPLISRMVSWHVVIGLALVPPVLLKMGSTLWRFSRYYLGDRRYRRAGPPHPFLRLLGPVVMGSTVLLIVSGVALWLVGPQDRLMFEVHRLTFVLWFGVVALHLLSHLLRASRLAAADSRDASSPRPTVPGARRRRLVVVASLVAGLAVGSLGLLVTTPWTSGTTPVVHQGTPAAPAAPAANRG